MSPLRTALQALARLQPEPPIDMGGLDAGWRAAAEVWSDDAAMERLLAAQAAFTVDLDRKAQAAYLVIDHSMMVSIATVVPLLACGVAADIAPDHIALRFDTRSVTHRGRSADELKSAMRLLTPTFATHDARWSGDPDACMLADRAALLDYVRRQLEACFAPFVSRLRALTGLPANAMWRLIGDSVAAVFLDAGRRLGCEEQAKCDALAILKQPGSPLANRQMGYFDIIVRDPGEPGRILASRTFRARGGCCRYYTSREGRLCSTCVLLGPADRDRRLEAGLRVRLGLPPAASVHPA